jgi:hypothetical protein
MNPALRAEELHEEQGTSGKNIRVLRMVSLEVYE